MRLKPIPADAKTRIHLSFNKRHFIRRVAAPVALCRRDENDDGGGFRLGVTTGDIRMRNGLLCVLSEDGRVRLQCYNEMVIR